MKDVEELLSSSFPFRPTRSRQAWIELCAGVHELVAQTNREARETILLDDWNAASTELAVLLQDGHSFRLDFDPLRSRVECRFPHSPNFNRALEFSAFAETKHGRAVWNDLRTGAAANCDELAGELVRNLLIMTSDS